MYKMSKLITTTPASIKIIISIKEQQQLLYILYIHLMYNTHKLKSVWKRSTNKNTWGEFLNLNCDFQIEWNLKAPIQSRKAHNPAGHTCSSHAFWWAHVKSSLSQL